jgi:hypothetical protein
MLKNKSFGTCKYNHAIMFDMLIIISCNLLKEQQKWLAEYLHENINLISIIIDRLHCHRALLIGD